MTAMYQESSERSGDLKIRQLGSVLSNTAATGHTELLSTSREMMSLDTSDYLKLIFPFFPFLMWLPKM